MSLNRVRSSGSMKGTSGNQGSLEPHRCDDIIKMGTLKKLKSPSLPRPNSSWMPPYDTPFNLTMKKKFFVLRKESGLDSPARLEYYDSERKFRNGQHAKKKINLGKCFSITKKKDPKNEHVIAINVDHDCICIAADTETDILEWLSLLIEQKKAANGGDDNSASYEHVWPVEVQPRGLGTSQNITGYHNLCLTARSLALVRSSDLHDKIEFPLNSIRRCGHSTWFFFLELGRSACKGPGELWMLTEDAVIAGNMHEVIRNAMHENGTAMNEPQRNHLQPQQPSGDKLRERTQSMSTNKNFDLCDIRRVRCESLPSSSRSRTSSEGSSVPGPSSAKVYNHHPGSCSNHLNILSPGDNHASHHPLSSALLAEAVAAQQHGVCNNNSLTPRPQSMYNSSSLSSSSCSPPHHAVQHPHSHSWFRYQTSPRPNLMRQAPMGVTLPRDYSYIILIKSC